MKLIIERPAVRIYEHQGVSIRIIAIPRKHGYGYRLFVAGNFASAWAGFLGRRSGDRSLQNETQFHKTLASAKAAGIRIAEATAKYIAERRT